MDHLPAIAMDSTPVADIGNLTINPKSNKSRKSKDVCSGKNSNSSRRTFVPRDPHMAKILHLLTVDLKAIDDKVNGNAKQKKGLAKVDRKWISNLVTVDWSDAFTEEGHLCVTRIMDMLPKLMNPPDAHKSLWISYRRLQCAALGLADYNRRNEGAEYYLVKPITSQPSLKRGAYVSHANFLAKRKDDLESPVELFFAEVFYSCDDVISCCLLEPQLYPPDIIPPLEKVRFDRKQVIHPEGFICHTCGLEGRKGL